MKKLIMFCVAVTVLVGCTTKYGDVRIETGIGIRDPFVSKIDTSYVMTGTVGDRELLAWTSPDLEVWDGPVSMFRPSPTFWGTKNTFWAPEVFLWNNNYYVFETFEDNTGKGVGTLILSGSQFVQNSGKITPPELTFALDGTLLAVGTEPWMLFVNQGQDGVMMACALNQNLTGAISPSVPLFSAVDCPWMVRYSDGRAVMDGPQTFWAPNGKLYLFWSTFKANNVYCVAQTRVESFNPLTFTQAPVPLFDQDGGHGMVFNDFKGNTWLSIHTPNKTEPYRAVLINLVFENEWFKVRKIN